MNLKGLFGAVESQMIAQLESIRFAIQHAATKGTVTEDAVKAFLRSHLPSTMGLESGFLIDSLGGVSKQLDIIIFDAAKTPMMFMAAGVRVIPIECAYAVIEVKIDLQLAQVTQCIENMKSAKSLVRKAYYEPGVIVHSNKMYGDDYPHWQLHYYVFAFESASLASIAQAIVKDETAQISKRIDSVYSLSRGLLANLDNGRFSAIPAPGSMRVLVETDALLMFYTLISQFLNQARIGNFRFSDYVRFLSPTCQVLTPPELMPPQPQSEDSVS